MKILSKIAGVSAALTLSVCAQQASTPGVITLSDGDVRNGYIVGASKTNVFYLETEGDEQPQSVRRSQVEGVYLMDPADYVAAMDLYKDRKYSEAYKRFGEVKKKYKKMELLADNYHHLAGFYELECLRKQMDLAGLTKAVADFGTPDLLREDQLKQLEAYAFWGGIQAEAWGRVIRMAQDWKDKRLPVSIRAQVAYCHGLALEKDGRKEEALEAYAVAMTADYTKSEVIVRNAVLNSLRVYKSYPNMQNAIDKKMLQDRNLRAAGALAALYESAGLGAGVDLPSEYKVFIEFAPDVVVPEEKKEKEASTASDKAAETKAAPAAAKKPAATKKKPAANKKKPNK